MSLLASCWHLVWPAVLGQLSCVCRRTVHDKQTGSDIVLSDEQLELVNRLQKGQFGDVNFNEYEVRPVQILTGSW